MPISVSNAKQGFLLKFYAVIEKWSYNNLYDYR